MVIRQESSDLCSSTPHVSASAGFDAASIESLIANAYSEAYGLHGDLGIDLRIFSQHLHCILEKLLGDTASQADAEALLRRLYTSDLYVGCACAQRSELGWERFFARYRNFIAAMVRFFSRHAGDWAELSDSVLADLFLPDRSGHCRMASYDGRSTLTTWLRVIIHNRVMNGHKQINKSRLSAVPVEDGEHPARCDLDSRLTADRYEVVWKDSLAHVCERLTHHERLLLLWRYEQHLQLGEIARMLGIHQSNVTRQLERIQGRMKKDVISLLASKHHLSKFAIEECLNDIVENPNYSVSILHLLEKGLERDTKVGRCLDIVKVRPTIRVSGAA
jgi:RNA polymerase sigma-70 factor